MGPEPLAIDGLTVDGFADTAPLIEMVDANSTRNPVGQATLTQLRITGLNTTQGIWAHGLSQLTITDSIVFGATPSQGTLFDLAADQVVMSGVVAGGAATSLTIASPESVLDHLTLAGNRCVVGPDTGNVTINNSWLVDCTHEGVSLGTSGELPACNAANDFVSYHPDADPALWDFRIHPRSYEKAGDWVHGFDPTTDRVGSVKGAYFDGGGLIGELADLDDDGLFDSWERRFGIDDPDDDPDGDGLSNFEEFGIYDLDDPMPTVGPTGTDPQNHDTDGDGLLDGADPQPITSATADPCPG